MTQNKQSSQICINLNRIEVLLPFGKVEPEKACEIVKTFTNKIILPEDFQNKAQGGRYELECRDGSILAATPHNYRSQAYCFTIIPYSFLETPS